MNTQWRKALTSAKVPTTLKNTVNARCYQNVIGHISNLQNGRMLPLVTSAGTQTQSHHGLRGRDSNG